MSPAIQQFLSVFLATLPLVGVIGWAAFQQNARFDMLDRRLDRLEKHFDDLADDLKALGIRTNDHEVRIAKIETKLDNPRLVTK